MDINAPASVGPCDSIPVVLKINNTGLMDSDVVVQVFLAQDIPFPSPTTRLVTFSREFIPIGFTATITLPPITPAFRSRVIDENGSDMYTLPGKRFNEPGSLKLRVCLGEHNCAYSGGRSFTVTQTGLSTDLSTC